MATAAALHHVVRKAPGVVLGVMALTMVLLLADGLTSPTPESAVEAFVPRDTRATGGMSVATAVALPRAALGTQPAIESDVSVLRFPDATLAPYKKAKRRRKYSSDEKPTSTLMPGFGDVCAAQVSKRKPSSQPHPVEPGACLPEPGHDYEARCIPARRRLVLETLDARNWSVEVWFMAGRRGYLSITPWYMKSTLRAFGGVAAKVVWLYEEGQSYVHDYAHREFRDLIAAGHFELLVRGNIRRMYRRSIEAPRTIVVKLDDDTVFVQEHAVTAMVAELLNPDSRCLVVSGNVINHVGLNPVHWYMGALDIGASAAVSPQSVQSHQMTYDGYQRNVLGSFQEPIEWRQGHVSFLRALREGALHRYHFQPSASSQCPAQGGRFDFQCDGMWRRWGINLVTFPALGHQHFGSMRDLGHLVKNKDEVYFSMEMGRHVVGLKNITCSVSDAIGVHFLNTGQASSVRRVLGLNTEGQGSDPRVKDASLLTPRLLNLYREVAQHYAGVKKCCRDTGCDVFNTSWSENPNLLLSLP